MKFVSSINAPRISLVVKPFEEKFKGDFYEKLMELRKENFKNLQKAKSCEALIKIEGKASMFSGDLHVETDSLELLDCNPKPL